MEGGITSQLSKKNKKQLILGKSTAFSKKVYLWLVYKLKISTIRVI